MPLLWKGVLLGGFAVYFALHGLVLVHNRRLQPPPVTSSDTANRTLQLQRTNPFLCAPEEADGEEADAPPRTLVLVLSKHSNREQRDAIRATWGRLNIENPPVRVAFLLGAGSEEPHKLLHEQTLYRDLVFAEVGDAYANITRKMLWGLQWVLQHCNQVEHVVKTDDDAVVRLDRLLQLLQSPELRFEPLLGAALRKAPVARSGQWSVPLQLYPQSTYPDYCSGVLYVLRRERLPQLLAAAATAPLIAVEDAFITGLLAARTGMKCRHHGGFPVWTTGFKAADRCRFLRGELLALHNVGYEDQHRIGGLLRNGTTC